MSITPIHCLEMLERVTELIKDQAFIESVHDPVNQTYQIMCVFRYPIGVKLEIDTCYNLVRETLGPDWNLKLSTEPGNSGATVAKLSAKIKFENGKST